MHLPAVHEWNTSRIGHCTPIRSNRNWIVANPRTKVQ
jgi:hypothetical protein